jgi:hypothetical protein
MDYHVCFGQDGDLRVSEIWDSQEKLEAFGERLMPILAEVGIQPGEPERHSGTCRRRRNHVEDRGDPDVRTRLDSGSSACWLDMS